ncbi:MAG: lysylphosphatidylglycerol synthase transmembrane domain-containing protein [Omnitrophica WOR_2 bacterium]
MKPLFTWRASPMFWIRLAGTLLAAVLVIYLLVKQWGDVAKALQQIPAGLFLMSFCLMIVSRLAVVGRWHMLLRAARVPVSLKQSARITFAGLFANNFLPTTIGGDVARLAGTMLLGFDRAVCLASLVVDRLVGMASMAMILPFGLPWILGSTGLKGLNYLALGMLAAGVAAPGRSRVKSIQEKLLQILRRLGHALALWKENPGSLLEALGFSWIHMICFISIMVLLLSGMGQSISVWLVAGLWSITYFVTQLPVSINGWGVQELSMTFLFTHFGGVSTESSITLALLVRTLQMLASLPGAVFIPGILAGAEREGKAGE